LVQCNQEEGDGDPEQRGHSGDGVRDARHEGQSMGRRHIPPEAGIDGLGAPCPYGLLNTRLRHVRAWVL
jgi:hypothetical protein